MFWERNRNRKSERIERMNLIIQKESENGRDTRWR